MVTTVGMNPDFKVVIESLITLEHDAMAAYEAAIERLDNMSYKAQMQEFLQDHQRHVQELMECAPRYGITIPTGGDLKKMLTTGKVMMADLLGDGAILRAMKTNEDDTVTAYERASNHQQMPDELRPIMRRAHEDELRHRAWMVATADAIGHQQSAA